MPIDEKTNEIPTIETLINGMDLTGIIATWDALNTQIKNVKAVIKGVFEGNPYTVTELITLKKQSKLIEFDCFCNTQFT